MHKLVILRGNSGSGKTTVAKALQELFWTRHYGPVTGYDQKEVLKERDGTDPPALPLIKETTITEDKNKDEIVNEIYSRVCNG